MNHDSIKKNALPFCVMTVIFLFCSLLFSFVKEKSAIAQTTMPSIETRLNGQVSLFGENNSGFSSPVGNFLNQPSANLPNWNGEQSSGSIIDFQTRLNGGESNNTSTIQRFDRGEVGSPVLSSELRSILTQAASNGGSEMSTTTDQGPQEAPSANNQQETSPSTNQSESTPASAPTPSGGGSRVDVGNSDAFASALGNARCGQSIIVGNGTYSGNFRTEVNCSAGNPLIIRAATPQQAIITSRLEVNGAHVHVRGFYFRGGDAHMVVYGDYHKVIGNKFEGWAVNAVLSLYRGRAAEVAYNEFTKPDPFRTGSLGKYPLRIGIRSSHSSSLFHSDAHIHHNYFHDFPAKPNPNNYHSGQSDAIEVCFTGSMARSGWLIEYNLIDRHQQGHGVLDVKCANGTTVRFNTLINSPGGRIDLRSGNGGKMIANWVENAGGIGIQADNHEIVGNVLTGSGYPELVLGTGNVSSNGVNADTQSANRNTLTCNVGVHNIGKYNMSQPARDNVVNAANGRVILGRQVNTRVNPNANCNGVPQARRLSANEVGLQGLARSGL